MNIETLIAAANPVPTAAAPGADSAQARQTLARVLAEPPGPPGRAGLAGRPAAAGTAPARRRHLPIAIAVAGTAAIAATATALALLPTGTSGASPAAARLLAKIAYAAGRQPVPPVRNSQFWYIKSRGTGMGCNAATGTCLLGKPHEAQIWQSVSNLCVTGLLRAYGQNIPLAYDGNRRRCPDRGGVNDPTYRFLQSLPTGPTALLSLIERQMSGQQPPPKEAFITIGDLLRQAIAPPRVSAALYRAAALLPGITVIPDATDAIGRHGVAVAMTVEDVRYEWIFSKQTLRYLGERDIYVTKPHGLNIPVGSIAGEAAVLQRAFVDHAGQIPR